MCRNKRLVEDERGKSSREVHPDQVLGGPGPCYDRACQPIKTSLHRFQRNHCPFTEGLTRALTPRRRAQTSTSKMSSISSAVNLDYYFMSLAGINTK